MDKSYNDFIVLGRDIQLDDVPSQVSKLLETLSLDSEFFGWPNIFTIGNE
jgi:hypothetical protein